MGLFMKCCRSAVVVHNRAVSGRATDRIGNAGTAIVAKIVNRDLSWIYRPQDASGTDYGIDGQIEVTDEEGVETGRLLAAQIKTGASYFAEASDAGFLFRGDLRHLSYWLAHSLPVLVILVNEQTEIAHWTLVQEPIERTKNGWKILVPRQQILNVSSKPALSAIAFGAGTERTRAKSEEREREAELERRIAELEGAIAAYIAQLATQPQATGGVARPVRIDLLGLSFSELLAWVNETGFVGMVTDPADRGAYVLAAEHLFFQETIAEHDAAKAVTLLLLAEEWGKAGSIFLYALDLARKLPRVETPSIIDLFDRVALPGAMPRDLRIVLRSTQITARRKHGRPVDPLLLDLDDLIADASETDAWAVTVAAFAESRAMRRGAPDRALRYVHTAATLRPAATGYGGLPFPAALDETWRLMLELTAAGVTTAAALEAWLAALALIPADARSAVIGDEMNCVTLANRFWLDESAKPTNDRAWAPVHRILTRIEEWSVAQSAALLFASARRGRVVIQGEYEDDLRAAIALATDVPALVRTDPHAMFLLNEIAASQFLYAGAHMESFVAFRAALGYRPMSSAVLSTTLLKAAQAAGAAGEFADGVTWARDAIAVIDVSADRVPIDGAVARAEYALALWFADDRDGALDAWDRATEELFAVEEDTPRWRGLAVRFHYVGGYLATTARSGTPPTVDADGKPYVEPRPGAFLIDLAGQAPAYTDDVRFGVLLALTMMADHRAADARAERWVAAALELATAHLPNLRPVLAIPALPHLVNDGRYVDALDLARAMAQEWKMRDVMVGADGELVATSFSIVPSVLAIARIYTGHSEAAATAAQPLVDACRAASEASGHLVWSQCASLIEASFISATNTRERLAAVLAIYAETADTAETSPVAMLSDLSISVIPGVPVDVCLASHARALPGLQARLSVFPTMYRLQVVPFFREFWRRRVAEEPAAFSDSSAVLDGIAATDAAQMNDRPRRILLAVAQGIRLTQ